MLTNVQMKLLNQGSETMLLMEVLQPINIYLNKPGPVVWMDPHSSSCDLCLAGNILFQQILAKKTASTGGFGGNTYEKVGCATSLFATLV